MTDLEEEKGLGKELLKLWKWSKKFISPYLNIIGRYNAQWRMLNFIRFFKYTTLLNVATPCNK